jgi:hypothetical protein
VDFLLLALIGLFSGTEIVLAQTGERGTEIFANVGVGTSDWIDGGYSAFGSGPTVGAGLGFRIIGGLRLEMETTALFASHQTAFRSAIDQPTAQKEGTGLTFSASAAYRFPTGDIRPYLITGIGVYTGSFSFGISDKQYSTDVTVLNLGVGVVFAFWSRVMLRSELRLYGALGTTSGDGSPARATIGAAYRL